MQNNTSIRKYIRHPSDVPIQVMLDWVVDDAVDDSSDETLTNVSLGGLSFLSLKSLDISQRVRVCIPILDKENILNGTVVWCEKSRDGYEVGLEFDNAQEIFRLRMIEQICHIEHYRKEIKQVEGRELTPEQAAREWISRYAGDFPAL